MAESMIRFDRKKGFTVIQNEMLKDTRLSLKTKGLFAVIISLPPDWDFSVSGLAVYIGVGRDAIRSSLVEMEKAGYLHREQAHGEKGTFSGNIYVIHEESCSPLPENPSTANPSAANPSAGEPSPGNPTQINKDLLSKDLSNNTPYIPPEGEGAEDERKKELDMLFNQFWKAYPRGEEKTAARSKWMRMKPSAKLFEQIMTALERDKASDQWKRGYIPYAQRWLGKKRWLDEVKPPLGQQQVGVHKEPPKAFDIQIGEDGEERLVL